MLLKALYCIFQNGISEYDDCDTRDASETFEVKDERCKFESRVRILTQEQRKRGADVGVIENQRLYTNTYNTRERGGKNNKNFTQIQNKKNMKYMSRTDKQPKRPNHEKPPTQAALTIPLPNILHSTTAATTTTPHLLPYVHPYWPSSCASCPFCIACAA